MKFTIIALLTLTGGALLAQRAETETIRAAQLWPGVSQFHLNGQGLTLYQWEASSSDTTSFHAYPDPTNDYLQNRIQNVGDTIVFSNHATIMAHIAIGSGPDTNELGIAKKADIRAYPISYFEDSAFALAANNMELSMHAYAENFGWNSGFWYGLEEIDSTEDYNWGRYTADTRFWDSLAFANPYYLAVRSSGNSRGESHSGTHQLFQSVGGSTSNYRIISSSKDRDDDGGQDGLDCLPPVSVAKNTLIVGAMDTISGAGSISGLQLRPGSATGPTDDGRIKPDLVAGGAKTSQSTAAVAGALTLLKEQFEEQNGRSPLNSTLRAIAINSAEELGDDPGPDYQTGHGLLNAYRAAIGIANRQWEEDTLQSADTIRYYVYAPADSLKVTLAWSDPPAVPVPFANSPSILDNTQSMLVNDLDMQLRPYYEGSTFRPWVLDLQNPLNAATTGDNDVDNAEVIWAEHSETRWWEIVIYHEGSLKNGQQAFSLAYSYARPAVVHDGKSWQPVAPDHASGHKSALITEGAKAELPTDFQLDRLVIKEDAEVILR